MKNSRYFFNNILKLEEEYGESYPDLIEGEVISVGTVDEVLSKIKQHMPKNYEFAEKEFIKHILTFTSKKSLNGISINTFEDAYNFSRKNVYADCTEEEFKENILSNIYLSVSQYNDIDGEIIVIPELCQELSIIKDCESFFESETMIQDLEYLNVGNIFHDSFEEFVSYYSLALFVSELAVNYKPMEDCLERLFNEQL